MSILQLDHLEYVYPGTSTQILSDVCTDFEIGKFYAIVGASGAGKSTLLNLLAGLDKPTSGAVRFDGTDIAETGYAQHRKKQISLVFQNYNLIDYLTPLENVRLVDSKAKVDSLLELGISEEEANRNVMQLSGGQQQRVAIARALAAKSPIILADEPTGNLDSGNARVVLGLLNREAARGVTVIVISHDLRLLRWADRSLELREGVLHEK